ncbi:MAG: PhzF family phenazine biosynthesis protein [Candidatus Kapaibacterium sp.]|nr:MAG: PhzF family phenazine biosynthesis protein [Candidatus Kapabacteria bacterium]
MQTLPIYQVDAFTTKRFCGNPAAIIPLQDWLSDELMQTIAMENNLAETAYFMRRADGSYDLRWFTPELEIPLCGHATLASAYVLYEYLGYSGEMIRFYSKSGELTVEKTADKLMLNFPARPLHSLPHDKEEHLRVWLSSALGRMPLEIYASVNNYFLVMHSEDDVRAMQPDFLSLRTLPEMTGIIVTAAGTDRYDCVSRYFAPTAGVPEDPVTGSAHCSIVPYWSKKLGKKDIVAYQASARGGELFCTFLSEENGNDRVTMAGNVVPYLKGEIMV